MNQTNDPTHPSSFKNVAQSCCRGRQDFCRAACRSQRNHNERRVGRTGHVAGGRGVGTVSLQHVKRDHRANRQRSFAWRSSPPKPAICNDFAISRLTATRHHLGSPSNRGQFGTQAPSSARAEGNDATTACFRGVELEALFSFINRAQVLDNQHRDRKRLTLGLLR
jgi:hypothetical protein